jgi:hypothetical protein
MRKHENIANLADGWIETEVEAKSTLTASAAAAQENWRAWGGVRTVPASDEQEQEHVAW